MDIKKSEWKVKDGYRLSNAGLEEMKAICVSHKGTIKAAHIVEAASDEGSALHTHFEWDDSVAAGAHRRAQAEHLIRAVVWVMPSNDEPVRVFHSLPSDRGMGGGVYRQTNTIVKKWDQREELLEMALADLTAFQQKYSTLEELAGVFDAIGQVKK